MLIFFFQYFGYDPETYWDPNAETNEGNEQQSGGGGGVTVGAILGAASSGPPSNAVNKVGGKDPPKLPRPLIQINCVQARTVLSRLLRYQQGGSNPSYGSKETEPPWWPNELIRWVDMVDLRGKPPYLPPTHNYTEVMKLAIERAFKYYQVCPKTYVDPALLNEPGMSRKHMARPQHQAPPVIPPTTASGNLVYVPPTPAPRIFQTNQPNSIVMQVSQNISSSPLIC